MAITKVRVKINGTWTNLTKDSAGKWTGSVTAPASTSYNQSGGYFPITVEATNSAGNGNNGGCHRHDSWICSASCGKRDHQAGH